jgi:hypothetical protein
VPRDSLDPRRPDLLERGDRACGEQAGPEPTRSEGRRVKTDLPESLAFESEQSPGDDE